MASTGMSVSARMLLLAQLMAKGGAISQNGKGLLKELAVQKKDVCRALVEKFEASTDAAESLEEVVVLVQTVIDRTVEELLRDVFFAVGELLGESYEPAAAVNASSELATPEIGVFLELLRRTGVAGPSSAEAEVSFVGCPRLALAARLSSDFERVVMVADGPAAEAEAGALVELFRGEAAHYLAYGSDKSATALAACRTARDAFYIGDRTGAVVIGAAAVRSGACLEFLEALPPGAVVITVGEAIPEPSTKSHGLVLAGSMPMATMATSNASSTEGGGDGSKVAVHVYQRQGEQQAREEQEEQAEELLLDPVPG